MCVCPCIARAARDSPYYLKFPLFFIIHYSRPIWLKKKTKKLFNKSHIFCKSSNFCSSRSRIAPRDLLAQRQENKFARRKRSVVFFFAPTSIVPPSARDYFRRPRRQERAFPQMENERPDENPGHTVVGISRRQLSLYLIFLVFDKGLPVGLSARALRRGGYTQQLGFGAMLCVTRSSTSYPCGGRCLGVTTLEGS